MTLGLLDQALDELGAQMRWRRHRGVTHVLLTSPIVSDTPASGPDLVSAVRVAFRLLEGKYGAYVAARPTEVWS